MTLPGTEIRRLRTRHAKVQDTTDDPTTKGNRLVHVGLKDIHYLNTRGDWQDIDPRWIFEVGVWKVVGVPFATRVVGLAGFTFQEGPLEVTSQLTHVGTTEIATLPVSAPTVDPELNRLRWVDVVPGLDIVLTAHVGGISMIKNIKTPTAPKEFTSRVTHNGERTLSITDPRAHRRLGWDNAWRTIPVRGNEPTNPLARPLVDIQRDLVVESSQREISYEPGMTVLQVSSRWTGQAKKRDPLTHLLSLTTDVEYPVAVRV